LPGQDIFISYSREDEPVTRRFAAAFRQEGFSVWWDDALRSGEAFDEVIEQELRSAKAVVVLWSPRSVSSRWVRAEATLADRRRRLAPVVIEPCDRPIIFELTHTVDLSQWDGDRNDHRWKMLVKDIHRLVGSDHQADVPATRSGAKAVPEQKQVAPKSAAKAVDDMLEGVQVSDLITALSTLRDAMKLKDRPAEATPVAEAGGHPVAELVPAAAEPEPLVEADDDNEATQVTTHSEHFALLEKEVHCLDLTRGDEPTKQFVVSPRGLKIGRSAPADIILPDSKVSRSHCLIEMRGDDLYVLDMNSTNGVFVDGVRVSGAGTLPLGSVLKVGPYSLTHEKRMGFEL